MQGYVFEFNDILKNLTEVEQENILQKGRKMAEELVEKFIYPDIKKDKSQFTSIQQ